MLLIYFYINYNAHAKACVYTDFKIFHYTYVLHVVIDNKAACARSKHEDQDEDKMKTLAFINILLVKIFPTLIRQYFPLSKFCAIWYVAFYKPYIHIHTYLGCVRLAIATQLSISQLVSNTYSYIPSYLAH